MKKNWKGGNNYFLSYMRKVNLKSYFMSEASTAGP